MRLRPIRLLLILIVSLCALFAGRGRSMAEDLVGSITREQLFERFPGWAQSTSEYAPREEVIQKLGGVAQPIEILVFLGTWCSTSESEVPKFLKVFERAGNPSFSVKMYGVDRAVEDGSGLGRKNRVRRVPTFIFLKNGAEIGRIVELPNKSIEEDFWDIVQKK